MAAFVKATDGVIDVLTASDIPGINQFGVIPAMADQPVFAVDHTRFQGEAVAAISCLPDVVPDLSEFPVTWTVLDPVMSPAESLEDGAPRLHEDRANNVLIRGHVRQGDIATSLNDAAVVATGTFTTSFVEHAAIEPEAGWAELTRDASGHRVVSIHASTQAPFMDLLDTAAILNVPPSQVVIRPTACGGGFGGKLDISVQPILALAASKLERPVRMAYSRTESMNATTKRHPASITASLGVKADGTFAGLDFEGTFNTGAYASWGPTVANRVPIHASGPYRYDSYDARSVAVHTNGPPAGAFRGFGVPQAAIAQETLIDEAARQLDLDPLEIRIQNGIRAGTPTVTGQVFESGVGYVECLEALRQPYEQAKQRVEDYNQNPPTVGSRRAGVGIAGAWYGCGNTALPNPSTIKVGLNAAGQICLHQGAVDIGQGSNTVMTQICADGLGIDIASIMLISADTDHTPDAGKTSASRQTYVSGNATLLAAQSLREHMLTLAGVPQSQPEEVKLSLAGSILTARLANQQTHVELSDLPTNDDGYIIVGHGSYDPPTKTLDEDGQGEPYAVFGFGAQVIELLVDLETGVVELLGVDAAYDVGRAINPLLVEGQVIGGVAQGVGLALMEEYIPGRTNNLHDYLIPTIGDIPEVRVTLVESGDPLGPFGAKGVGEHSIIPTPPAILNAIRNAIGAPVRDVPATPERVLAAIRTNRRESSPDERP